VTIVRKDIRLVFPTPIFRYDVAPEVAKEIEDSFLGAIAEVLDLARLAPAQLVQTQTDLHRSPRYQRLCGIALNAVRGAALACGWKDADYLMTGLWLNVSTRGHGHRSHTHPNNIFSGVYYLRVAEGANKISFEDPRGQASMVRMKGEKTTFMYDTYSEKVRNGAMVLFPSWLRHFVPANESDEPRISASFNFMVRGFAEDHSNPEWQGNLKLPS